MGRGALSLQNEDPTPQDGWEKQMGDEKQPPRKTSIVGVGEEVGEENESEVQHELEKSVRNQLFQM